MEKASKLWRLLKVFTLIEGKPGIGAAELAERCETSLRTVYRDVYLLKLAGIPIYYQKGYRIAPGFFLPPVQFDLTEMLSLAMGAELLSRQKGTPFQRGVESAMEKIYAAIPPGIREAVERESVHFTPAWEPTVDYARRLPVLDTLEKGVEEERSVAISYHSLSRDEVTRRKVDPYGFLFRSNAWYLVGYCHLRGEIKIFKVDRILEAELLGDRFQLPEDFSIREYMGDAWQVLRGEPREVEIRFSPQVAPYVKESIWHFSQRCRDCEDGSAVLSFRVSGLTEICSWLMAFGGEAEVLRPPELKEMLLERARGIVEKYSS
ncbi:transcriptional regulator [Candidatus Solincola tengchongensis]|uniref:helix-turn-helix transcriptional regulator n=1 Tax=Candidatus Solincola tengchongensis TaxID=2900693 RepID=UPI00257E7F22|nr:transcriptional regulator [Candidatus Solincola tengchongensis]